MSVQRSTVGEKDTKFRTNERKEAKFEEVLN